MKTLLITLLITASNVYPLFAISTDIEVHTEKGDRTGNTEFDLLHHTITIENDTLSDHKVSIEFDKKNGEFQKIVEIALTEIPDGYFSDSFKALIPFYKEGHRIEFLLYAHNYEPGNRAVIRELYSTDPTKLNSKELFRYYAKSYLQAGYVLSNVPASGIVYRDHVQAVYNFLQSVRELAWKYYIEPDDTAQQAYQWFQSALKENTRTVCAAVQGSANAKQILDQYKHLQTEKYAALWRNTLDLRIVDFDSYCSVLYELQKSVRDLDPDTIKAINDEKKLMPLISTAFAECLWKGCVSQTNLTLFAKYRKTTLITNQILLLLKQSDIAKPWTKLVSDILNSMKDLQKILEQINKEEVESISNQ